MRSFRFAWIGLLASQIAAATAADIPKHVDHDLGKLAVVQRTYLPQVDECLSTFSRNHCDVAFNSDRAGTFRLTSGFKQFRMIHPATAREIEIGTLNAPFSGMVVSSSKGYYVWIGGSPLGSKEAAPLIEWALSQLSSGALSEIVFREPGFRSSFPAEGRVKEDESYEPLEIIKKPLSPLDLAQCKATWTDFGRQHEDLGSCVIPGASKAAFLVNGRGIDHYERRSYPGTALGDLDILVIPNPVAGTEGGYTIVVKKPNDGPNGRPQPAKWIEVSEILQTAAQDYLLKHTKDREWVVRTARTLGPNEVRIGIPEAVRRTFAIDLDECASAWNELSPRGNFGCLLGGVLESEFTPIYGEFFSVGFENYSLPGSKNAWRRLSLSTFEDDFSGFAWMSQYFPVNPAEDQWPWPIQKPRYPADGNSFKAAEPFLKATLRSMPRPEISLTLIRATR